MVDVMAAMLPRLLDGALNTLIVMVTCTILSLPLALVVAVSRLSSHEFLSRAAGAYVFVFRGTPALVQLFFVYYGFSMSATMRESWAWYFFQNAWFCSIFALTLNTAAYQAEIFRGALQVVPSTQIDAAWSLGLSKSMTFWLVRVPEAFRLSLPGYGNELILLLKATSIVSTITILDLLGTAKLIYTETFDPITPLLLAAAIYLVLVWLLQLGLSAVEWWLMPHMRDALRVKRQRNPHVMTSGQGRSK
jgi:His/Glu/Gln/Arg/opine family amino acid ABC transporter permease subunit